ncbi:glycoside hydrolase family 93 protein [Trematosphaeria pertusa]|uniref:Glycoside hydrolase family 93 protein n=1 Tax=Trematosphaeria pertusa TaxID=390896 RepID=A0A6A6IGH9_9PLEO|nr:glycoside hydrolase family 93 protein [Trematosphaeria pertusa]KAF2249695.1 glycoside hydrolase family 93 protein [Trematosphaeria pertusa]
MRFLASLLTTAPLLLLRLASAQLPQKDGSTVVFGTSGTYPRAVRLADNSLLGTYTLADSTNQSLVTVRSTDNGASWAPLGTVVTNISAIHELGNSYVHQLPDGKVLCAFRNHDLGNGRDADPTYYRITVCLSEDLGETWRYLSTPAQMPGGPDGVWEPFLQNALDGSLQLYYSKETGSGGQDSILRRSTDGGKTWSAEQTFTGQDTNARDGMLGVARTAANSASKVAIFESGDANGHFTVHTMRTADDDASWDSRGLVYENETASAGAPQIIRVGSRMVASFGTNEDGGVWPQGAMKVMVSTDQGKTWASKTTVHVLPAMWAGLLALDDKSFLALYETGGTSYAQKMTFP